MIGAVLDVDGDDGPLRTAVAQAGEDARRELREDKLKILVVLVLVVVVDDDLDRLLVLAWREHELLVDLLEIAPADGSERLGRHVDRDLAIEAALPYEGDLGLAILLLNMHRVAARGCENAGKVLIPLATDAADLVGAEGDAGRVDQAQVEARARRLRKVEVRLRQLDLHVHDALELLEEQVARRERDGRDDAVVAGRLWLGARVCDHRLLVELARAQDGDLCVLVGGFEEGNVGLDVDHNHVVARCRHREHRAAPRVAAVGAHRPLAGRAAHRIRPVESAGAARRVRRGHRRPDRGESERAHVGGGVLRRAADAADHLRLVREPHEHGEGEERDRRLPTDRKRVRAVGDGWRWLGEG
mmetsp:Transcript_51863/g.143621  ORF Transcript_51863/g.143621 Transcript_51863/m.143621 type:complete len:358 (-) Transcript_51863:164-1237(-)